MRSPRFELAAREAVLVVRLCPSIAKRFERRCSPSVSSQVQCRLADDAPISEAEAEDEPDPPPNRVVFYWWPKSLKACPQCGGPLPS